MVRNSAFVFIKPHALTDKVKDCVKEVFEKNDIIIKTEGELGAEDIDKYKKIDKHYYAIASKATILTPDKIAVPAPKFKEKFGKEWEEALQDGSALNAMDACEKFGVSSEKLDSMWAACKKAGDLVKFGGGFYCGKLEHEGKDYYVFNGFFMSMRSKFVEPGAAIYYYVVEWESDKTSWADFRGKVLGPTDPAQAPADSLRGMILAKWKELGLKSEPNVGDNGMHASASPFEALSERVNWLGYRVERDPFGKLLLKTGVSSAVVRDWCKDPQVTFGPVAMTKSLFDTLEDTDSDWCLALCQMIAGECKPQKAENPDDEIKKLKAQIEGYKSLEKAVLAIQSHVAPPPPKAEKKAEPEPKKDAKGGGKGGKGKKAPEPEKPPLRAGKGSGKGGSSTGGKGGGGGGGGGKRGGKDGGGPSVSRLKVMPKFLQEMTARLAPKSEDKRGLAHARLNDKTSGLGRNDNDEYDVEGATIVDSDYTADDVRVFGQFGKKGSSDQQGRKTEEAQTKKANGFFLTEAPKVEEEDRGPMTFKKKMDRSAGGGAAGHKGVGAGGTGKAPDKKAADEDDGYRIIVPGRRGRAHSPSPPPKAKPGVKKQKLSFGGGDDDGDSED